MIVDNASTDGTRRGALARRAVATSSRPARTSASPAAATSGARATHAPLLLFLNPDSAPQPDCLELLRARGRRAPRLGRLAGRRAARGRAHQHQRRGHPLPRHRLGRRLRAAGRRRCRRGPRDRVPVRRRDGGAPRAHGASSADWIASTSCTERTSISDCACGSPASASGVGASGASDPQLRVRQGERQVVLAGAQPLAHGAVGLPDRTARAARAGAAGSRARPARGSPHAGAGWEQSCAPRRRRSPGCRARSRAGVSCSARDDSTRTSSPPISPPRSTALSVGCPQPTAAARPRRSTGASFGERCRLLAR